MSLWRRLARGFRTLARRADADRDLADEIQHFMDETAAQWTAKGLRPDEARRAARLEVGDPAALREQVRESGWENVVAGTAADVRHAGRRLRRSAAFTVAVSLTLALGIGASTAIFSAVKPALFDPLPYPDGARLVLAWYVAADGSRIDQAFGTYREIAARSRSFAAAAATKPWSPVLTGSTPPERLAGQKVSADYFQVLGIRPAIGRDFAPSDDRPDGPRIAMLADSLWRRRFGADPAIVGRQVRLDEDSYQVAGIMPRSFENVLAPSAEIWSPLQYDAALPSFEGREWGHHLQMVARLREGVERREAERELDRLARSPVREFSRPPWAAMKGGIALRPLHEEVVGSLRPALVAVLGAVALLVLIACVNVASLLLARGVERRGELALRAALGAGRTRLARQLFAESLLLACLGGALGFAVATFGLPALVALAPPDLPRASSIRVDGAVFLFTAAVTLLVGLGIGAAPALAASRHDLARAIHGRSGRAGTHQGARRALVVAEVALALVLLVGAGLLLRSLERLFDVPPGFDASHVLTLQVQATGHRFDEDAAAVRFFDQVLEAVRRVPGVSAAGFTSQLPLSGDHDVYGVHVESVPNDGLAENGEAFRYAVSPGYCEAMRIALRRGRLLDGHDRAGGLPVVLVNDSFAARVFPGRNPVGQRLHLGRTDLPWYTIVGVVGDVKQDSLASRRSDAVYVPAAQWYAPDRAMSLVVRARDDDAASLAPAIRRAIWAVDRDQPISRVATIAELLAGSTAQRRFALVVFEAFGLAALCLAAVGVYGLLSGSVTERAREIGVRSALGATRAGIVSSIVTQGLVLTAVGLGVGAGAAVLSTSALVMLLFGVSPLDPVTYLGVSLLLLTVSAVACWAPAWRAARIDPATTLRAE